MSDAVTTYQGEVRGRSALQDEPAGGPPAFAWRETAAIAGLVGIVLLLTGAQYGFHRDELYHIVLGDRLFWGYADTGSALPLLTDLGVTLFGESAWAVRVPSALLSVATVVIVALLARELGGGRRAQVLAAFGTAASAFTLMIGHVFLTTSLDEPLTLLFLLFVIRALRRGESRWWLAAGAVFGLAWYNKFVIVMTGLALVAGLLLAGPRQVFRNRLFWGGILVAFIVGLPNLIFQATHGWVEVQMAMSLSEKGGAAGRAAILPTQLTLVGPFLLPVWIIGLVRLWRDRGLRVAGVMYPVFLALMVISGPRPDYIFPLMLVSLASGCIALDGWLGRDRMRRAGVVAGFVLNAAFAAVISLPLIPVQSLPDALPVDKDLLPDQAQLVADQVGWPEYIGHINDAYQSLPEEERANTVILTGNYGEAGAVYLLGRQYGLPPVYSGHNQFYFYGPPPESATTVIFSEIKDKNARARLFGAFDRCYEFTRITNEHRVPNEELDQQIEICRGLRGSWADIWPAQRHFD